MHLFVDMDSVLADLAQRIWLRNWPAFFGASAACAWPRPPHRHGLEEALSRSPGIAKRAVVHIGAADGSADGRIAVFKAPLTGPQSPRRPYPFGRNNPALVAFDDLPRSV